MAKSADSPAIEFVEGPDRPKRAEIYEEKVAGAFGYLLKITAERESTVPDAAAIIEHGPDLARTLGDLAHHDVKVRKAIDFISKGTDNPYLAVAAAALPLAAQILRNHEHTELVDRPVTLRIPFLRREWKFPLKLRFTLKNPFLRAATVDPASLTERIFADPEIREALHSQGIEPAWKGVPSPSGTRKTGR